MRRLLPIAVISLAVGVAYAQPDPGKKAAAQKKVLVAKKVVEVKAPIKAEIKIEAKVPAKTETKVEQKAAPKAAVKDTPTSQPTQAPETADEAVKIAKDAFQAGKARNWWLMSALIIWLLIFGLKVAKVFEKVGRRWAYIIVGGLSMAALLVGKFAAGISWEGAIAIMTSGPFMAFANDFFKRGILGKEPTNTVRKLKIVPKPEEEKKAV